MSCGVEEQNNVYVDRELPHSREAEESVLGSILTSPESVAQAAEVIVADDFYYEQNRKIYEVAIELFNENIPVEFVTVGNRLNQRDELEKIGGNDYLTMLAMNVPTTQYVEYYAEIIREKAQLRRLIVAGSKVCNLAYSANDDAAKILEQSEQLIFDVSSQNEKKDIVPIKDILMESYDAIVESSQNKGKINGLSTGFRDLNFRTGGFHGGELILIAGRPGMGKSSFAVNIAEHVAFSENKTVAIFNLEMPKTQIVSRILCSQAMVDSHKIKMGDISADDWMSIGKVLNKLHNSPMYIDDTATITVSEIRAKCRRLKQTKDLALVVIDYLQLMESGKKVESRQNEVAQISRSLKILAKELDIPVIALSQLSRASEARSDKRPMLSDLRESGSIEQDADMVMFLYRDEYYNKESEQKGIAECILAKHRQGEPGTFYLGWKGAQTKFVNIEYEPKKEDN